MPAGSVRVIDERAPQQQGSNIGALFMQAMESGQRSAENSKAQAEQVRHNKAMEAAKKADFDQFTKKYAAESAEQNVADAWKVFNFATSAVNGGHMTAEDAAPFLEKAAVALDMPDMKWDTFNKSTQVSSDAVAKSSYTAMTALQATQAEGEDLPSMTYEVFVSKHAKNLTPSQAEESYESLQKMRSSLIAEGQKRETLDASKAKTIAKTKQDALEEERKVKEAKRKEESHAGTDAKGKIAQEKLRLAQEEAKRDQESHEGTDVSGKRKKEKFAMEQEVHQMTVVEHEQSKNREGRAVETHKANQEKLGLEIQAARDKGRNAGVENRIKSLDQELKALNPEYDEVAMSARGELRTSLEDPESPRYTELDENGVPVWTAVSVDRYSDLFSAIQAQNSNKINPKDELMRSILNERGLGMGVKGFQTKGFLRTSTKERLDGVRKSFLDNWSKRKGVAKSLDSGGSHLDQAKSSPNWGKVSDDDRRNITRALNNPNTPQAQIDLILKKLGG